MLSKALTNVREVFSESRDAGFALDYLEVLLGNFKSPKSDYTLNTAKTVAVATDVFWNNDMSECPRGCKVQLLGKGGVAVYSSYSGDLFWTKWSPLPKIKKD